MRLTLIGLNGAAGAGKDTVAEILVTRHGFEALAFADPIRAALLTMCPGLTAEHFTDRALKERESPALWGRTPRAAMQSLGTGWAHEFFSPDHWICAAHHTVATLRAAGADRIVITDCRYAREADYIIATGGKIITVARPGAPFTRDHSSAQPLPAHIPTRGICNDRGIDELAAQVERIVEEW